MFLGHFAASLAAKKIDRKISLGTLFLAGQFIDLLWPIFLLAGFEHVRIDPGNTPFTPLNFVEYPYTHSLLAVVVWSVVVGSIYFLLRRRVRGAVVLGALVASHWFLDFLMHRPDLPLAPGAMTFVGLGLWYSPLWTIIIEGALFIGAVVLYAGSTRSLNAKGRYGFWSLIAFLVLVYVGNILGPPPPSEAAVGWVGLTLWALVPWAYWVDKNRMLRDDEPSTRVEQTTSS